MNYLKIILNKNRKKYTKLYCDNTEETFSLNECNCKLCSCINNIYNEWENWEPTTPFEKIFETYQYLIFYLNCSFFITTTL